MSYTVWDVETTIRESYKRKANPFDPANFVVMSGYKRTGGAVEYDYFGKAGPSGDWFTKLLLNSNVLVGANIKFDLLYALRDPANLIAWMAFVARGGLVWDIQLAEYLLNGMGRKEHMLSLDELAPRYGGNVKFDEVKVLWNEGVCTTEIDKDLLVRYLCGTDTEHGDIGNTELVFLGQLTRARACGQLKSIYLNMGSLICTTEMERNGMAVDIELGHKLAGELQIEVEALSKQLNDHLPTLPFEFNWNSPPQKSALIFGGNVKYEDRVYLKDAQGNQLYAKKQERGPVLDEAGNPTFYKAGKNAGEPKTKLYTVDDLDKPKSRMEPFYYTFPRLIEPKKKWQGSVEGVYSTSAEVISELGGKGIPFLDLLVETTSKTKDLTTYYITTDPKTGEQKGMLTLVQPDGIIHHKLNHTSTVTARFSSSDPNLQNLPKEGKSVAKSMFISRFGDDGKITQSDFTSLEVYVQAILTNCFQLIEDLKQGLDMHCVRVSQAKGEPYEKVYQLAVLDKDKLWSGFRTKAKVFSFQRAYGAGAALIAESTGMPREDVDALIIAENERYPEIERFYVALTQTLKENRVPTGDWFQHPDVPGLSCNPGTATYRTPDGKLYAWTEGATPEFLAKKGTPTSFSPTEIKNYPVQGTGGEWAKAAMWLAVRAWYSRQNFGGLSLLVNQVHDALYTDSHKDVALEASALLHACMEEASAFMEWYFDWKLPLPVPSDTTWGANMMDEQKMPEGFGNIVQLHRAAIRSNFIDNHQASYELAA